MKKTKKLARCPFCSSKKTEIQSSRDNVWWVDCTSRRCGASGPIATTEAGAIKRWGNQRVHIDKYGGQPPPFEVTYYRRLGEGVNVNATACKVKDPVTGRTGACEKHRSRDRNRDEATRILLSALRPTRSR